MVERVGNYQKTAQYWRKKQKEAKVFQSKQDPEFLLENSDQFS